MVGAIDVVVVDVVVVDVVVVDVVLVVVLVLLKTQTQEKRENIVSNAKKRIGTQAISASIFLLTLSWLVLPW